MLGEAVEERGILATGEESELAECRLREALLVGVWGCLPDKGRRAGQDINKDKGKRQGSHLIHWSVDGYESVYSCCKGANWPFLKMVH